MVRVWRRYLNEVATVGPSDPYAKKFHYFGEGAALMAPQGVMAPHDEAKPGAMPDCSTVRRICRA